jgi:hypothetical protein
MVYIQVQSLLALSNIIKDDWNWHSALPPDDLIAPDMIFHVGVRPGMLFWIFQTGLQGISRMAWYVSIYFIGQRLGLTPFFVPEKQE